MGADARKRRAAPSPPTDLGSRGPRRFPGGGSDIHRNPGLPSAPRSVAEAADLLNGLEPLPADYPPLLRLGPAVPTANQLGEQQGQISGFTLSSFSGGSASGTGNQNYSLRINAGLTDQRSSVKALDQRVLLHMQRMHGWLGFWRRQDRAKLLR